MNFHNFVCSVALQTRNVADCRQSVNFAVFFLRSLALFYNELCSMQPAFSREDDWGNAVLFKPPENFLTLARNHLKVFEKFGSMRVRHPQPVLLSGL